MNAEEKKNKTHLEEQLQVNNLFCLLNIVNNSNQFTFEYCKHVLRILKNKDCKPLQAASHCNTITGEAVGRTSSIPSDDL